SVVTEPLLANDGSSRVFNKIVHGARREVKASARQSSALRGETVKEEDTKEEEFGTSSSLLANSSVSRSFSTIPLSNSP
ncbi:hypothetical protein PMAYCL1PPCAC_00811, partial [Pristionchus mayeri]